MAMTKMLKGLDELLAQEIALAKKDYADYSSAHEGFAIMLEEVDEVQFENTRLLELVDELWQSTKEGDGISDTCVSIKEAALRLAAEAIQVACVAYRIIEAEETE